RRLSRRVHRPQAVILEMRAEGLEPPRALAHEDLNLARLPVPPRPRRWADSRPGTAAFLPSSLYVPQHAVREDGDAWAYGDLPKSGEGREQDDEDDRRADHAGF